MGGAEQCLKMIASYYQDQNVPLIRIVIINNPISEKFKLKNKTIKNSVFHLITVGRLVKVKGHRRVMEALEKLKIPLHYTIIGNAPEENNYLKK